MKKISILYELSEENKTKIDINLDDNIKNKNLDIFLNELIKDKELNFLEISFELDELENNIFINFYLDNFKIKKLYIKNYTIDIKRMNNKLKYNIIHIDDKNNIKIDELYLSGNSLNYLEEKSLDIFQNIKKIKISRHFFENNKKLLNILKLNKYQKISLDDNIYKSNLKLKNINANILHVFQNSDIDNLEILNSNIENLVITGGIYLHLKNLEVSNTAIKKITLDNFINENFKLIDKNNKISCLDFYGFESKNVIFKNTKLFKVKINSSKIDFFNIENCFKLLLKNSNFKIIYAKNINILNFYLFPNIIEKLNIDNIKKIFKIIDGSNYYNEFPELLRIIKLLLEQNNSESLKIYFIPKFEKYYKYHNNEDENTVLWTNFLLEITKKYKKEKNMELKFLLNLIFNKYIEYFKCKLVEDFGNVQNLTKEINFILEKKKTLKIKKITNLNII